MKYELYKCVKRNMNYIKCVKRNMNYINVLKEIWII